MLNPPTIAAREFDLTLLHRLLGEASKRFDVEHLAECSSTNSVLLLRAEQGAASGSVVVAHKQTAGRGRRGRRWHSAPGHSLTFSVLWRFKEGVALSGLSLAVGVGIVRALERLGVEGLGLKWPNDIWLYARKLGGVLVEAIRAERGTAVVIGIGLNVRRYPRLSQELDQAHAALDEVEFSYSTEHLLATLLGELLGVLDQFATSGFAALQAEWGRRNALQMLPVTVLMEGREIAGVCGGVDERGALELLTDEGSTFIWGGDVSLRPR